jgi:hypothetical protein
MVAQFRFSLGRIAVILWSAILAVVAVRVLLKPGAHSLFPIFVDAAQNWMRGVDVYGALAADVFRYSPLVAVLTIPFTFISDGLGEVSWRALNVAIYFLALAWWYPRVSPATAQGRGSLLFLLVIPLSVGSIANGQTNPMLAGSLLAGVACVAETRWSLAAACLAVAIFLKAYPIAVALLLVCLYPRQLALRMLLAVAVGLALPFAFQRFGFVASEYIHWFDHMRLSDRTAREPSVWYRDLRLLCKACHMPIPPRLYLAIQLVGAAGFAAVAIFAKRAGQARDRLLATTLGLGCCWMTVFGAVAESSTYMLLAPTLAVTFIEVFRDGSRWPMKLLMFASYSLFTATAVASWFPFGREFHSLGVHAAAGLFLMLVLLIRAFASLRSAAVELRPGLARAA